MIYYIGYATIKDSKYVKINSVNSLYFIFSKVNGYFEEINKSKYLTLLPSNESKEQKYGELWSIIRGLIRSISKNLDDYDEKYMKISFSLDDELPLNQTIEIPSVIIVVGDIFMKIINIIHNFFR